MIETHHLSKFYSRGLYALRDLSLTVGKGEFVFLTGPSGAGKSTLLRLLLAQDKPSEGDIVVNGHDLSKLSRGDVAYQLDFRRIYATMLRTWLKADDTKVLGNKFDVLPLFRDA